MQTVALLLLLGPALLGHEDWPVRDAAEGVCRLTLTAAEARRLFAESDDPEVRPRLHRVYRAVTVRELDALAEDRCGWPEAYRISGWIPEEPSFGNPPAGWQQEWVCGQPEVYTPNATGSPDDWAKPGGRYDYDPEHQREVARRQLLFYLFRTGDRAYVEKAIEDTPRD